MEDQDASAFNDLSRAEHPGTMNGFAGELATNLEKYVNGMVEACCDALQRGHVRENEDQLVEERVICDKNTLHCKLGFLRGNDIAVVTNVGRKTVKLAKPWIPQALYRFLDSLRKTRNEHVHGAENVYGLIAGLGNFMIALENGERMLFLPHAEQPGLHHHSFRANKSYPSVSGNGRLEFMQQGEGGLPQSRELDVRPPDLVPGNENFHDLIMHVFTLQEFSKWCSRRGIAQVTLPDQKKKKKKREDARILTIVWGRHSYSWFLTEHATSKHLRTIGFNATAKRMLYFRFNVAVVLGRLAHAPLSHGPPVAGEEGEPPLKRHKTDD